jgi:hypothetical protein
VDWDSVVGTATCYRLDVPGIETQRGTRFSVHVKTGAETHPASCIMGTGFFSPGIKRPGRGVDHPFESSAEVKERVMLYLYSPFGPS